MTTPTTTLSRWRSALGLMALGAMAFAAPAQAETSNAESTIDRQIERLESQIERLQGNGSAAAEAQREALQEAVESLREAREEVISAAEAAQERSSGLTWLFNNNRNNGKSSSRRAPEPYVGVTIESVPRVLRDYIDLPKGVGLLLERVHRDSPAAKAGLEDGDIMVQFDGQLIVNFSQFSTLVNMHTGGDVVPINVLRKGEEMTFEITIEDRVRAGGRWLVPDAPRPPDAPAPPAPPAMIAPTGAILVAPEEGQSFSFHFESEGHDMLENLLAKVERLEGLEDLAELEELEHYGPLIEQYASQIAGHVGAHTVSALQEWLPGSVNVTIDDEEQILVDLRDLREELGQIETKLHRLRVGDRAAMESIVVEHGDLGARTTILHMENANFNYKDGEGAVEIYFEDGQRMARITHPKAGEVFHAPLQENFREGMAPELVERIERALEMQQRLEVGDDALEIQITTDDSITLSRAG